MQLGPPRAHRFEEPGFQVGVLVASPSETLRALKRAVTLAADLDCRISLIYVQVVLYPLPLEHPPVDVDFLAERLRAVADEAAVLVEIHLYFGRDILETLEAVLHPDTILVIGSENQGWGSRKRTLIKRLLKNGYSVVLAEQQKTSRHPLLGKLKAFRQLSGLEITSSRGILSAFEMLKIEPQRQLLGAVARVQGAAQERCA